MSIPVPPEPVSLDQQIKEVEREIGMRFKVYAGRMSRGDMTKEDADKKIATMQAVLETLKKQLPPPAQSALSLD